MNRTEDLIFFSLPRWDHPISSPALSLAIEFSRHNRVFYIEHPLTWKDVFSPVNRKEVANRKKAWSGGSAKYISRPGFPPNLKYIVPPRMLPVNFVPAGPVYNALASYNDRLLFRTMREVIRENDIRDWIYFNSFDPFYMIDFPQDIRPRLKVYQSMDDISQVAYTARHGLRLEEEIIRKYDLAIATGTELTRLKKVFNPSTYYLPNAADISLFRKVVDSTLPKPEDMKDILTPVIGFTGSVEYRSDFELLKKMVERHADKTFVVVGPVYADEVKGMGFDKMKNVRFTGARHISELANYLQYMDVMIIPYKLNTLTKSIYPLKINEYLGAGKPVVATHFSEDIYSFRDVAYIAESHDEFLSLIDRAIAEDSPEKKRARVARAEENTWTARVRQFWEILEKAGY